MVFSDVSEMVAMPRRGRVFTREVRSGFADCAPSGRVRLDSLARWLQDVAYADVEDGGVAQAAVWVLRRTRIRVGRWPRFAAPYAVSTFCSGMGRMWAERRTSMVAAGDSGPDVEASALWVHLDPEHWRPTPLTPAELELYSPSADGRRVTARLRHPGPEGPGPGRPWRFRPTELDIAAHINNAAYWEPLEDELMEGEEPEALDVEIEFRTPAQPGEGLVVTDGAPLRTGARRWLSGPDGVIHASVLIAELR